ncbi:MAG TPA: heme-binding protein, partial [Acetobacteraceae bacterium]|nr:heme-binding protein [Acetobacteraceae bacterium]
MPVRLLSITSAFWLACTAQSSAQALMASHLLTAEAANTMVMAALAECQKNGYRVSAAVVDRGGNLLAFVRDPTAGPHTAESSRRKAFTAATFGMTSAAFA